MPIYTICPSCNTGYDLADNLRGKRVICKTCNDNFLVEETFRAAAAGVPVALPAPSAPTGQNPLQQPGYHLNPPADEPNPSAYPRPPEDSEWDRLPRRRPGRRPQQPRGLSTGAIVAIVVTPVVVLVMVGVLILVLTASSNTVDDPWVNDPPRGRFQPGPRPAVMPIVIPGPRINNQPQRFNPQPFNPPRINPPRINPPRINLPRGRR